MTPSDRVIEERAAQGLPPMVEDLGTLERIATTAAPALTGEVAAEAVAS